MYNSLDPKSVAQHLALYELYPHTPFGQQALGHAWKLLAGTTADLKEINVPSLEGAIHAIVALVNTQPNDHYPDLSDAELSIIERLAKNLPNRQLKGHYAGTEADLIALPSHEIDLSRGLFLSDLGSDPSALKRLQSYEAALDLMALQIRARLPDRATPEDKIRAINQFIFVEMGFRFPPHSLYAKDIDLYTFLPSVLDSRRGVCLGVSILYICLAQRLNLHLEMVTPPGHIYVRYRKGNRIINIETTARGIHLDSEEYLGIDTRSLQQRSIKDVIGLAQFNQASVYLAQENYAKALECYEKAQQFLPDDMLLKELMGYCRLFVGDLSRGRALIQETSGYIPEYAVSGESMSEDYLNGRTDEDGIKAIFMHVDETRESVLKKQAALLNVLERYPKFRSGLFALATTWVQLHRLGEALQTLEKYHEIDSGDPTVEYYLAALYAERFNYPKAWAHLKIAESLTNAREHAPKALKDLRLELARQCPE